MNVRIVANLKYNSYTGRIYANWLTSNGGDPTDLTIKVFNTKKPKAEVSVGIGWFSESRGVSGTSPTAVTFKDAETVALCRAAVANETALAPLVDKVLETVENDATYTGTKAKRLLARWFVLANSDNPNGLVNDERRERAREDKPFAVGDKVLYHGRHNFHLSPVPGTVTAERFEWSAHFGGGWLYTTDSGHTADALSFHKAEPAALSA